MLFRRNKKVEEALLFYACAETYKRRGIHPTGSPVRYQAAPIVNDHGGRARAALDDLRRSRLSYRILSVFRPERRRTDKADIHVPDSLNLQPTLSLSPAQLPDSTEA